MTEKTLLEPYALGSLALVNCIVMVTVTHNNGGAGLVPSELGAHVERHQGRESLPEALEGA